MGGPRNGKYLNIVFIMGLLLFAAFMVYVHHETKMQLEESSRTVSSQSTRHEKLTNEFKDLIQAHAQVESQLRVERSKHQKTISAKASIEKKYTDDVRETKERCENERKKLSDERDSFKLQAQEHEGRYKQASLEHDRLEDQCKDDAETAKENFLKLQASCQEGDRQLQAKSEQLSNVEKELKYANFQVKELKIAAETGQSKLGQLQSELKEKEKRIGKLEAEVDGLGQMNKQLKQEQQEQEQQNQRLQEQLRDGPPGQHQSDATKRSVLKEEQRSFGQDAHPGKPPSDSVTSSQKRHVFETLRSRLQKGENLSQKQRQIYYLLSKQFSSVGGEGTPRQGGGLSKPSFERQKPNVLPKPSGTQQRLGHRPPYPTPNYYKPKFGETSPPEEKASEVANMRGVGIRPPPPSHGDAREDDWPADKLTHPLEEEEEVRDLKFEDQQKGKEIGNGEEEGADADHAEKFDNLEEEEKEGEEGGAQQGFNPEEIEEERKKDELEEQKYQENEDRYDDREEDLQAINVENLPQPKESQEGRVIAVPPQDDKGPVPVPGPNQDQNLDQKYEYDNYEEEEEEDDDEKYVYKDDGNGRDKAEVPHGLDELRRIMARRDSEGQQQKLASDHDAHPREEPDFPELAKLINRRKEELQHREIR